MIIVEYIRDLALSYFELKGANYKISELAELLGYSEKNVDRLLGFLIENKWLKYENYVLKITDDGKSLLDNYKESNIYLTEEQILLNNINPNNAMGIDVPYIPKGFSKKFK